MTPPPAERELPVWRVPVRPRLGGRGEDWSAAGWWWLGAHGGAGVTTLSGLVAGGADAHRCWPDPAWGGPDAVILVCRTSAAGLGRVRDTARQWAAGRVPAGILLAGVVAVADAPGRLSRGQVAMLRMLSGVVPRVWRLPWLEVLRAVPAAPGLERTPQVVDLDADLAPLRAAAHPGRFPGSSMSGDPSASADVVAPVLPALPAWSPPPGEGRR